LFLLAATDALNDLVSGFLGMPVDLLTWLTATVELFADLKADWWVTRRRFRQNAGRKGFRMVERHQGRYLTLRSGKGARCAWSLAVYDKSNQDADAEKGIVRIECRAWSEDHIEKLTGSESRKLGDVLFGGRFHDYFRQRLAQVGLAENLLSDPATALESANMTRKRKVRLATLLVKAEKHGWQTIKDRLPIGSAEYNRFQDDVRHLRKLGILSGDADSNRFLGDVCRSVLKAAKQHQRSRILLPDRMSEIVRLCDELARLADSLIAQSPKKPTKPPQIVYVARRRPRSGSAPAFFYPAHVAALWCSGVKKAIPCLPLHRPVWQPTLPMPP
jgi:hypothetical protein